MQKKAEMEKWIVIILLAIAIFVLGFFGIRKIINFLTS